MIFKTRLVPEDSREQYGEVVQVSLVRHHLWRVHVFLGDTQHPDRTTQEGPDSARPLYFPGSVSESVGDDALRT